ncbi:MAG TPA: COX aromatic rich motif-containing protein [Gammaproteobacteria bacterium]|jgi:cytochrome o ubiquinol oxidase subunit 2|nr:COX aromatic rich motif-containing protein [Gammaproteobacteria bacterium]
MIAWKRFVYSLGMTPNMLRRLGYAAMYLAAIVMMLSLTGCKESFTGMLNPKGIIAYHERKLFFDTMALMLIVVLPVIVMSFAFLYHYQVSHHIRDYEPNWSHSFFLEGIWWGIPIVIIVVLAALTWKKTHDLDPYNPIPGSTEPRLLIQAIALPWNWLFIYPEENIATLNYLEIPVGRQVEFWFTTDNVAMSAFIVPQLGSQIYAMAGMRTRLHYLGDETGVFDGENTQYNGNGFSDMHFPVHVVSADEMKKWVDTVKRSDLHLTQDAYHKLLIPVTGAKPQFYSNVQSGLFENVIHLYMHTFGAEHPRQSLAKYNEG